MQQKNLLKLHEAIVVALLDFPERKATFDEIAEFLMKRKLYENRKGNITRLSKLCLEVQNRKVGMSIFLRG
jgi:hypothetical protein